MANVFKCKMCGGTLNINENDKICTCEYCGTTQTVPNLDTEKRTNLYDRANHFRRNSDYDRAMSIYEQILQENNSDFEAYWNICLCRYGIEYVEDPSSKKQIPTINRAQYNSILNDPDYLMSIKLADDTQKQVLINQANEINEIQKGILEISNKEKPFDVFICYKETDNNGRRTIDSVLAQDIYKDLTNEGYSVFFARITLEDKLGSAYEPYIFSALNSSKVMIVVGTKKENLEAVWVRNEWSRYLSLINNGDKKVLIPCYKDMDPYDLPQEFSHLQAQDLNKIGFMQDLEHGIAKIVNKNKPTVSNENSGLINIGSLENRVIDFIENSEWNKALEYCEKILDFDLNNAKAYEGRILAKNKIKAIEDIFNLDIKVKENLLNDINYKHLYEYCDFKTKKILDEFKVKTNEELDIIAQKKKQEEEERKLAAKKKKKAILISFICFACLIASFGLYILTRNTLIKNIKAKNNYKQAITSYENGNYDDAMANFSKSVGYLDTDEYLLQLNENNEVFKNYMKNANIGDELVLGNYEQDNNATNGPEAIEWIVISNNHSNIATLVSKDIIEYKQFDYRTSTTYLNSDIFKYLNNEFYNRAFNDYEKSLINPMHVAKNRLDILSCNVSLLDKTMVRDMLDIINLDNENIVKTETLNFIKNDPLINAVKAKPSEYVIANGGNVSGSKYMWYWLADPRYEGVEYEECFSAITSKGRLSSAEINMYGGVRPIIKILY